MPLLLLLWAVLRDLFGKCGGRGDGFGGGWARGRVWGPPKAVVCNEDGGGGVDMLCPFVTVLKNGLVGSVPPITALLLLLLLMLFSLAGPVADSVKKLRAALRRDVDVAAAVAAAAGVAPSLAAVVAAASSADDRGVIDTRRMGTKFSCCGESGGAAGGCTSAAVVV
jgi:hypothetical protein